MKKTLVAALAASFVLGLASTALASDVLGSPLGINLDGSITFQYRNDDFDKYVSSSNPNKSVNDWKTLFVLNANRNIAQNLDLYARFTYESFLNTTDKEFGAARDYIDKDYNGAIDAFGLKYANAGYKYTLGSQALTLGATGILYDNGYIGKHALPYALTVSGKSGATDLTAVIGKTNYQSGKDNDNLYALQGSYALNDKATVGAVFAQVNYGNSALADAEKNKNVNYYTLNTSYKLAPNLTFTAEYLKSDADRDNKGYVGAFSYKPNSKDAFTAAYWRVEDLAAIEDNNFGSMTTFWGNAKGYTLAWSHKVSQDVTFSIADHNFDSINSTSDGKGTQAGNPGQGRNTFRAGVTIAF